MLERNDPDSILDSIAIVKAYLAHDREAVDSILDHADQRALAHALGGFVAATLIALHHTTEQNPLALLDELRGVALDAQS